MLPLALFLGAVAAAALVRVAASLGDFWLDEIWSWYNIAHLSAPWQVFTRIHLDNNHHLMSLLMYLMGPNVYWVIYRIPSVVAGVLSVVYAARIAREYGRWAAGASVALVGGSYLFVHYSSEARGYALCVFFALFCYYHLRRYLLAPRAASLVLFLVGAVLGILSHLEFLGFLLACALWLGSRTFRRSRSVLAVLATEAKLLAVPALAFAALYFGNVRGQRIGGGNPEDPLQIAWAALSLAIGGPVQSQPQVALGLVTIALVIAGLVLAARRDRDEAVFYGAVLVLAPLLQAHFVTRELLQVRYFLVPLAFLCLLLAHGVEWLAHHGRWGMAVSVVLLLGYLAGNGANINRLLCYGRGSYLAALTSMVEATPGPVVTVSSTHDSRAWATIDYYRPYLHVAKTLTYVRTEQAPAHPPEWLIIESTDLQEAPAPTLTVPGAGDYQLVRDYPCAGLSGFAWAIYRRGE